MGGEEKERKRNNDVQEITWICCLLHTPRQEPGLQPKRVPCWGIKPATLQFTGGHSIHRATPARAR